MIGPGTARALRERGIEADLVPERSVAESLVEALADVPVTRALIARAEEARDVLPDALRERGARGRRPRALPDGRRAARRRARGGGARRRLRDVHQRLVGALLRRRPRARSPARGSSRSAPSTSEALRELGREPDVEADRHTPDGLVEALLADVARRRAG